jgi:hypothetical protein
MIRQQNGFKKVRASVGWQPRHNFSSLPWRQIKPFPEGRCNKKGLFRHILNPAKIELSFPGFLVFLNNFNALGDPKNIHSLLLPSHLA